MADTFFVGLRASDDVVSNERPESWREGVLRLFPNGSAPLTALTALMPSSRVDDPHYHWWTETLAGQRTAVTNIYSDADLGTAYVSGGVAGDVLYVKIPVTYVDEFRAGHQVLLRDASDETVDVTSKVNSVTKNGANSVLVVTLLEDDDNSSSGDLSDCDTALIIGSMNPEGGTRPDAIGQSPSEFENVTQIWRNPLDLTRTRLRTRLRTGDSYKRAKMKTLEDHSIEIEKSLLFGTFFNGTGVNGKPERTTRGLKSWCVAHGTTGNYTTDTDYSGSTWLQGGVDWLDVQLETIFRYGSNERLAFCGSGALLGIQRLVRNVGAYNISVREAAFGIEVLEWITPFGRVMFRTHPLFSFEATNRRSMLLFEPANLSWRYVDDTTFMPDKLFQMGGGTGYDGKQEEFLTEAGLEIYFPTTTGWLNGFNSDNELS